MAPASKTQIPENYSDLMYEKSHILVSIFPREKIEDTRLKRVKLKSSRHSSNRLDNPFVSFRFARITCSIDFLSLRSNFVNFVLKVNEIFNSKHKKLPID